MSLEQAKALAVELGMEEPSRVDPMEVAYKMTDTYYRQEMEARARREQEEMERKAQDTVNRMADAVGKEGAENQQKMRAALRALAQAIEKAAGA